MFKETIEEELSLLIITYNAVMKEILAEIVCTNGKNH